MILCLPTLAFVARAQDGGEHRGALSAAVTAALLIIVVSLVACETNDPFPPALYSTDERALQVRVTDELDSGESITRWPGRPVRGATSISAPLVSLGEDGGPPFCTDFPGTFWLETMEPPVKVVYQRDLAAEPLCGDRWYLWDGEEFTEYPGGALTPPGGAYGVE